MPKREPKDGNFDKNESIVNKIEGTLFSLLINKELIL